MHLKHAAKNKRMFLYWGQSELADKIIPVKIA